MLNGLAAIEPLAIKRNREDFRLEPLIVRACPPKMKGLGLTRW